MKTIKLTRTDTFHMEGLKGELFNTNLAVFKTMSEARKELRKLHKYWSENREKSVTKIENDQFMVSTMQLDFTFKLSK